MRSSEGRTLPKPTGGRRALIVAIAAIPFLPALLGIWLLIKSTSEMSSVLSVETALTEIYDLRIQADCSGAWASVSVMEDSSLLTDEGLSLDPTSKGPSGIEVNLVKGVDCSRIQLQTGGGQPRLLRCMGCTETKESSADQLVIEASDDQATAQIVWPNLFRFSHEDAGWANRWLGPRAAALHLFVNATSEAPTQGGMKLDVLAVAPAGFTYHRFEPLSLVQSESNDSMKHWSNYQGQQPITSSVILVQAVFRHSEYDGKTNFVTVAGGAVVGLAFTLIIEPIFTGLSSASKRLKAIVAGRDALETSRAASESPDQITAEEKPTADEGPPKDSGKSDPATSSVDENPKEV